MAYRFNITALGRLLKTLLPKGFSLGGDYKATIRQIHNFGLRYGLIVYATSKVRANVAFHALLLS